MSFFDIPADAIRWVFDLNIVGTILPCQVFGKRMVAQGAGNIINISSMSAFRPLTKTVAYSAAKAAVSNFTQWLAVHLSQTYDAKIRVNAIAPGFFLTEQNRFLVTRPETGELTPRGHAIVQHTPMGRLGDPVDLVGTVLWFALRYFEFRAWHRRSHRRGFLRILRRLAACCRECLRNPFSASRPANCVHTAEKTGFFEHF